MRNEKEIEAELRILEAQLEREATARILVSPKNLVEEEKQKLDLERELAAVRGQEYATEIVAPAGLGLRWHMISGFDIDTFLVCDMADHTDSRSAVFRFHAPLENRFGGLNDEVLEVHPLYGRGLAICGLHRIHNSEWIKELHAGMSCHLAFDAANWKQQKHFLFRDKGGEMSCVSSHFDFRISELNIDAFLATIIPMGSSR